MQAVIKTGGKQYKVAVGDTIRVEKLNTEAGQSIALADVLMLIDGDEVQIGAPYVENSTVNAKVVSHGRGKKISIVKFKRRKHHLKKMGHRQSYTELNIEGIAVN